MSKKSDIQAYLLDQRRGETVAVKWLKYDLWDKADILASRSTIRAALNEMRVQGQVQRWGGGRSVRWHINTRPVQ